jgi:Ni,Fe-hydrogenase III large subunit
MIQPIGILNGNRNRILVHDGNQVLLGSAENIDVVFEPLLDAIERRDSGIGGQEVFGNGVFDFRYGPVTGGVMESGVYHLYTYGERILCVNIDWSYKHRDIEKSMIALSVEDAIMRTEDICGNFAFSHSLAFSRAVESALGIEVPMQTKKLRILGLELERIYNHIYVIMQLASAAAQKVMGSHLYSIYEDLLRLNKDIFGSRFLRGINGISIIKKPIDVDGLVQLGQRIKDISSRFDYLYERALESKNFMDRLHNTAKLDSAKTIAAGATGPTLRATGVREDFRLHDSDYDGLRCATSQMGDSLARMEVRAEEIFESTEIILDISSELKGLKESGVGSVTNLSTDVLNGTGSGIGYCESPTGLLAYYVEIEEGKISYAYAATPSLFGFKAITEALVGNIFTDFPFAVDSFGAFFADAAR